jgi:hypothetical protein
METNVVFDFLTLSAIPRALCLWPSVTCSVEQLIPEKNKENENV